jgi:hypothetical protein
LAERRNGPADQDESGGGHRRHQAPRRGGECNQHDWRDERLPSLRDDRLERGKQQNRREELRHDATVPEPGPPGEGGSGNR